MIMSTSWVNILHHSVVTDQAVMIDEQIEKNRKETFFVNEKGENFHKLFDDLLFLRSTLHPN